MVGLKTGSGLRLLQSPGYCAGVDKRYCFDFDVRKGKRNRSVPLVGNQFDNSSENVSDTYDARELFVVGFPSCHEVLVVAATSAVFPEVWWVE